MVEPLKELAIQLLSNMHEEYKRYDRCNKLMRGIEPDFPMTVFPINGILSKRTVELIDAILGDDIGSYFLWEASTMMDGGRIIEVDGTEWPIRTIEDVRAYLNREEQCDICGDHHQGEIPRECATGDGV